MTGDYRDRIREYKDDRQCEKMFLSKGMDIGTVDAMIGVSQKNNLSPKVNKLIEALQDKSQFVSTELKRSLLSQAK